MILFSFSRSVLPNLIVISILSVILFNSGTLKDPYLFLLPRHLTVDGGVNEFSRTGSNREK